MGVLRTLLVVLLALPTPAPAGDDPLVVAFASCAGRFSAELEHAWLLRTDRTVEIERRRQQFIDLLNAAVPMDQQRQVVSLRIDAKAAHAALLSRATFSQDRNRARWALRRAESEIAYCSDFLLES